MIKLDVIPTLPSNLTVHVHRTCMRLKELSVAQSYTSKPKSVDPIQLRLDATSDWLLYLKITVKLVE